MSIKYTKSDIDWELKDGLQSAVNTHVQRPGKGVEHQQTVITKMRPAHESELMVLTSDAKGLLPWPSRGAVLRRTHQINLSDVLQAGEIALHPEIWDEYIKNGTIDEEGNALKVSEPAPTPTEEAPAETPTAEQPTAESAEEPAPEASSDDVPPGTDPATVEGEIPPTDLNPQVAVAPKVSVEETVEEAPAETPADDAGEGTGAAEQGDPADSNENDPTKCVCGKTKDHEGNCDGSHDDPEAEQPANENAQPAPEGPGEDPVTSEESNPNDVNNDGKVDSQDVKEVADEVAANEAAAEEAPAEEAPAEESVENKPEEPSSEDNTTTQPS